MKEQEFAIWLYGSCARGDVDRHSDRDVLVVGYAPPSELSFRLAPLGSGLSVSHHDWPEIVAMADYGSLFLHHLRLEGTCVFEPPGSLGRLTRLLGGLGPYTRARRDLKAFELAMDDVRSAPRHLTTPQFEMTVLATVLRHSSVLGCYVTGAPKFGRTDAFRSLSERWSIPPSVADDFTALYRFRLYEEGRSEPPYQATWAHVDLWTAFAGCFLRCLEEEIHEYESRVLAARSDGERSWR